MGVSMKEQDGLVTVVVQGDLSGAIESELEGLLKGIKAQRVHVDCQGIGMINSHGIRVWRKFLSTLSKKGTVELHRCPTDFIDTANLVPDFAVSGTIVSFYAPLRCPDLHATPPVLLKAKAVDLAKGYGKHVCAKCNRELVAEVPAEDYLAFLESAE